VILISLLTGFYLSRVPIAFAYGSIALVDILSAALGDSYNRTSLRAVRSPRFSWLENWLLTLLIWSIFILLTWFANCWYFEMLLAAGTGGPR
jgi:polyferredoxin